MRALTSVQACSRLGITYRQLDSWDRIGAVSPSVALAAGSGSRRLYSEEDLVALSVVAQVQASVPAQAMPYRVARRALAHLAAGHVGCFTISDAGLGAFDTADEAITVWFQHHTPRMTFIDVDEIRGRLGVPCPFLATVDA